MVCCLIRRHKCNDENAKIWRMNHVLTGGKRVISLKDLAKECNVSVATASKALHDYPDIGSKKRDYIKQKARELGYYPNSHASALKNNKSRTISLLYGDILGSGETGYNLTGDYFSHVFESFRQEADHQSYGIILSGFYAWDKRRNTYGSTYADDGYRKSVISSPASDASGNEVTGSNAGSAGSAGVGGLGAAGSAGSFGSGAGSAVSGAGSAGNPGGAGNAGSSMGIAGNPGGVGNAGGFGSSAGNVGSAGILNERNKRMCETISETEAPSEEYRKKQETLSVNVSLPAGEKRQSLSQAQLLRYATRTPAKPQARRMSVLEYCRYRSVDGVVLAGVDFESDEIQELLNSDLPVVTLDYISPYHSGVSCDLWTGMENLINYIYTRGHRSYVYLYTKTETGAMDKLEAFEHVMKEYQIPKGSYKAINLDGPGPARPGEALSLHIDTVIEEIAQGSRYIDKAARTTPDTLPCIICSDDTLALYAMRSLLQRGLQPGVNASLAGYGGNRRIKSILPDLTTLEQDTAHIGRLLAGRLIDEIEYPASGGKEHTIVKGALRKGNTIAAV